VHCYFTAKTIALAQGRKRDSQELAVAVLYI